MPLKKMTDKIQIKARIASLLKQPIPKLGDETLLTDLVVESFALIEMVIELQEEFKVRLVQDDLKSVKTVADLANLIESRVA
jgi:acyl carrier protein